MTKQELFDRAAKHLLQQGRRATDVDGVPMYRAPDGTRCAIGAVIPDGMYHPDIEFTSLEHLNMTLFGGDDDHPAVRRLRGIVGALGLPLALACDLQALHDEIEPNEWPIALREIARLHRLSDAVIDLYRPYTVEQGRAQ